MDSFDLSKFVYKDDNDDEKIEEDNHKSPQLVDKKVILTSSSSTIKSSSLQPKLDSITKDESVQIGFLPEKYCSPGKSEKKLRLLLIGHNPSEKSWTTGHYYANPSNRMWYILRECGIVPEHFTCVNDDDCPDTLGIGFTDLGTGYCETESSKISDSILREWSVSLFRRIEDHMRRVHKSTLSIDDHISEIDLDNIKQYAPYIIAFAGVRQWKSLFPKNFFSTSSQSTSLDQTDLDVVKPRKKLKIDANYDKHEFIPGKQSIRPTQWPKFLEKSEVFVLPSTSGAAALSNEDRINPYREIAARLRLIKWPLQMENE